jgi:phenylpyruvate tautomerase PptA (4-oxalocrotonate tautomerase family)
VQEVTMPIVHVYSTEGWLSAKRKKLMIEKITDAIVAAEGVPEVREITAVLIHDVGDGGWSFRGRIFRTEEHRARLPPDPED